MSPWGVLALVRFESPGYLALLGVLPLLIVFSYRSLASLGGARRLTAILIRCLVITIMVCALAGMERTREREALTTIFLLDRSNSIPRKYQQEAFAFVRRAAEGLQPNDRVGVIAFDGRSAVEQLPSGALSIDRVTEPVDPERTDIAAALRLAMAMFPPDTSRRVVLLSDGNENAGDALKEAEHYRAAGVPIDVVPILYAHRNEVVFEQLRAPPTANVDESVNVQMVLRTEEPVSGRILFEHNGELVDLDPDSPEAGFPVTLRPGANRFTRVVPMRVARTHRFRAVFVPDDPEADTSTPTPRTTRAAPSRWWPGRDAFSSSPPPRTSPGRSPRPGCWPRRSKRKNWSAKWRWRGPTRSTRYG